MIKVKALLIFLFFMALPVWYAAETECGTLEKCDSFESNVHDRNSLQRGLGLYKNYCSSCHTLRYLRWNRLERDLDIPENILVEDLINNPQVKTSDFITFGLPEVSAIGAPDLTLRTRVIIPTISNDLLDTFLQNLTIVGVLSIILVSKKET